MSGVLSKNQMASQRIDVYFHGLKAFFESVEGRLGGSPLIVLFLSDQGDGIVALGMELPELFLEVVGFPWPSDEVSGDVGLNFEGSPLSGEVGVFLRRSIWGSQGD